MRKINGKLLLGLLLGTTVCTGAVFGVHQFQYRRIAQALLWQARRAEEQGQTERMARYLSRYLEFNPRDLAEKAHLARAWAGDAFAGNVRTRNAALRLLQEVLRGDDRPELRRLLVRVALEVGQNKTARDSLTRLLPFDRVLGQETPGKGGKPDPERGELEGYWGQLLEAENRPEDAVRCCRLAVLHAPGGQDAYVRLAYLLRRHKEADEKKAAKNRDEADRVMGQLVRNNKPSYRSYLARWRYRRDFDLIDLKEGPTETGKVALEGKAPEVGAAEDVADALKRAPEEPEVLLAKADLERLRASSASASARLEPDEREEEARKCLREAEKFLERGLAQAAKQGQRAGAVQFRLLWHKAGLLLDELKRLDALKDPTEEQKREAADKEAAVVRVIEQVRKARGASAAAEYLQGRLRFHARQWAEAAALLEQARAMLSGQPDLAADINLYLGQCYEHLEDPTQMLDAYKRAADADPSSVQAQLGIAAAHWALGDLQSASDKYARIMDQKQVPSEGWLDIARLALQRALQSDRPDWTPVEKALDEAQKIDSKSAEVVLLRADLYAARKDLDRAEKLLIQKKTERPEQVELWTALADLHLRRKQYDRAFAVLDEAEKKLKKPGDQVLIRLARARCLAAARKKDEARAAISRLADGVEHFKEEDRARLLGGLADAQLRAENLAEARELWRRVAQLPQQRTNLRLRLLLFDLALRLKDEPGMEQALQDIRAVERREGAFYLYGQALRLIWQVKNDKQEDRDKALADARVLLDQAANQRGRWAAVYLARAEVSELGGSTEQAILDLQEALHLGEKSPAVIRRLAELLHGRGRYSDANRQLARLRASLLREPNTARLAAGVAIGDNQVQRALELAEPLKDSRDYKDLVWLGGLHAAAGEFGVAEQKLRQATRVAPREPVAWVALVQFLAGRKDERGALAAIAQARAHLPADKAALALAQCYEALGRTEDAQKYYDAALRAHRNDVGVLRSLATFHLNAGRLHEAEPFLSAIAEGKGGATAADVAWAKPGLAIVLASGTDYRRFQQALSLVGLRLDANGQLVRESGRREGTDTLRAQARVLATQGQRQFRKRAIEILQGLDRGQALTPDDQYILALLYDADGDKVRSRDRLRELVRAQPQAPRYLAQFVYQLIAAGELAEAESHVGKVAALEKKRELPPNSFASVELRARLLEARKEGDAALTLLRKHIGRPGAKPEEVFLVMASLQRQHRWEEAFRLCEQAWKEHKCPPEVTGGVSVALLRAMQPTDEQVHRVEARLKEAVAANPKSAVLVMHLADLYDLRGRYPEAEAAYRDILAKEPGNVVALNNLAWLLAQRAGDAREALDKVTTAINGLGRRPDLLDTRALVHLALNEPDKAVADLKEATEEAPTPTRLFHLARAHYQARDRDKAARVLRKAKESGLQTTALHPVEQDACRRLLAELKVE